MTDIDDLLAEVLQRSSSIFLSSLDTGTSPILSSVI